MSIEQQKQDMQLKDNESNLPQTTTIIELNDTDKNDKKIDSKMKRSVYIIYLIITFSFGAIQSYPSTLIPQFERQINWINPSDIAWLFATRSLGYCFATITVGVQLDFFDNTHYFASITMLISLIPFIFMNIINNFSLFILFWFIIGFVTGTMDVSVPVYIWRLYATSASARYTSTGIMSGIGGTLMPLTIELSLYLFNSYNIASYLLSFILFISAISLIIYKTPRHENVVKQIKTVRNKNIKRIQTLRNKQKQLRSKRNVSIPNNNNSDIAIPPTPSIGIILENNTSNTESPQNEDKMNTLELLKKTFTEILISNDNLNENKDINIFDIEENANAAGIGMNGIFNPILLHEINEANESAGIDDIINTPRSNINHIQLKSMLSTEMDDINDLDVLKFDFSTIGRTSLGIMSENENENENKNNISGHDQQSTASPLSLYEEIDLNIYHNNNNNTEEMCHWFGVEKPLQRLMTKIHNKGKSRRNISETQESIQLYYNQQGTHYGNDNSITVKSDKNANWNAMKEGLKRDRYKQELIICCVILMIFYYGFQTVLLANIISFNKEENIGRYLISMYSFSKYISRFILLIFPFTKYISLQQSTFIHLLLLFISSVIFWIVAYNKFYDKNNIYLYFIFMAFGIFGACIKTAIFSICRKIQPISGFIASIFLLSKCFGDGIIPWIVAKLIDKYDFIAYVWMIGCTPFIMLISWICITKLFECYNQSKNKIHTPSPTEKN